MMQKRNESLDAMRGLAILGMVLSGSIAFGNVLPAWMYHAQVPPPNHIFHPDLPGITWVDLVFPFFLFSMGAAIPLSFENKLKDQRWYNTTWLIAKRALLLCFFAIFLDHVKDYMYGSENNMVYLLGILGFVLLHVLLVKWPFAINNKISVGLKLSSLIIAAIMLWQFHFKDGSGFKITRMDIIIVVLANMAVFASIIWIFTKNNPIHRLLVLPIVMGIFLSNTNNISWQHELYNFTPINGLYSFYYLKYLFIVIPGTIAGEWLQAYSREPEKNNTSDKNKTILLALLLVSIIVVNLIGLFQRYLFVNLIGSIILIVAIVSINIKLNNVNNASNYFIQAGSYLLLLGLIFEAYEGGIKKDHSTYSYYFVTSGLAFLLLYAFIILESKEVLKVPINFLANIGKNPMVAYVSGSLLITPILHLSGLNYYFNLLNANAFSGFLKGIIYTGLVALITLFFVKKKYFWKT